MILSGHQPNYLPGIVRFNKIALSDKFMICQNMQFEDGSWHNRNYIRGPQGPLLLTVPIKHNHGQTAAQAKIDYSQPWQRKHRLKWIRPSRCRWNRQQIIAP